MEDHDESGASMGLLLGCPIGLALMLVGVVLVLTVGIAVLAFLG